LQIRDSGVDAKMTNLLSHITTRSAVTRIYDSGY
jgi:hypothetical protein